jgi:hypothetical protein
MVTTVDHPAHSICTLPNMARVGRSARDLHVLTHVVRTNTKD